MESSGWRYGTVKYRLKHLWQERIFLMSQQKWIPNLVRSRARARQQIVSMWFQACKYPFRSDVTRTAWTVTRNLTRKRKTLLFPSCPTDIIFQEHDTHWSGRLCVTGNTFSRMVLFRWQIFLNHQSDIDGRFVSESTQQFDALRQKLPTPESLSRTHEPFFLNMGSLWMQLYVNAFWEDWFNSLLHSLFAVVANICVDKLKIMRLDTFAGLGSPGLTSEVLIKFAPNGCACEKKQSCLLKSWNDEETRVSQWSFGDRVTVVRVVCEFPAPPRLTFKLKRLLPEEVNLVTSVTYTATYLRGLGCRTRTGRRRPVHNVRFAKITAPLSLWLHS